MRLADGLLNGADRSCADGAGRCDLVRLRAEGLQTLVEELRLRTAA